MRARRSTKIAAAALSLIGALVAAAPAGAAPANDNIVDAQVLPAALPISIPATTIGATGEPGEEVFTNPATESVWFSWTPAASTTAIVDTCGPTSGADNPLSGIGVYTGGTTFASLVKVTDTTGPCKLKFAATAGTTYKIQIDFLHVGVDFIFGLHAPQPPANDNFVAAQTVPSALPATVPGSTIEATFETGEPAALGGSGSSRSVWYSWKAPASGHVQVGVCPFETQRGSAANKVLAVYNGATLATLAKVVETNNCTVEFDAVANTTYKIAFSGHFNGEGNFTLALRDAPPPANDNFAAAQLLSPTLPQVVSGDNSFATTEMNENAVPIGGVTGSTHSVWYRWMPAVSERVKLNACGSDARPRLGIFTGAAITALKPANEPPGFAPFCAIEIDAIAGTEYSIAIAASTFDNSTGPFQLDLHKVSRPINDDFTNAISIGPDLPVAIDGTIIDATVEPKEVRPSKETGAIATVWYRWDAAISGPVVVSTCGSVTDVVAGVHTGADFATMTLVAPPGEEDAGPCPNPAENGGRDFFAAVAGTTYWIQVSGPRRGVEGAFHLTIVDPNAKPAQPGGDNGVAASPPGAVIAQSLKRAKPTLKDAIARCRKTFPGKGPKARTKRAACIARAKLKFAIVKCREGDRGAQRRKCVAAAHQRFGPDRPGRNP